jgi:hypothetical protein
MAFLKQPSQYCGSLSAGSHTPRTALVYCLARVRIFVFHLIQALCPALVSFQHRHVPRAPLLATAVTSCNVTFHTTSGGMTLLTTPKLIPYPAVSLRCSCSLLPRVQRPHIQRHTFGTLKIPLQCNFNREVFSGLRFDKLTALSSVEGQSFSHVQAPTLVSPPGCTYR